MFSLKLLGGVSLSGETGPVPGSAAQRRRLALLALLAAAPAGRLSRDKIVSLLWPESETTRARHLLADSLYELRSALGKETLSTVGEDVALDAQRVRADVGEFARALAAGDRAAAVAAYGGPFLDGFFLPDAPEFERWAEERRADLAHQHARAIEALADAAERAGDVQGAVGWWKRLAATDPYSSRVALRLMRALVAAGDPASAIQHARVHETLLREELAAPPDAEVMALVAKLKTEPPVGVARTGRATGSKASPPPSDRAMVVPVPAPTEPSAIAPEPPVHVERPGFPRAGRLRFAPALVGGLVILGAVVLLSQRRADEPPIRSLAVLPFVSQSPDSAHRYLADAIADALTTELARYSQLTVESRIGTTPYDGTTLDPRAMARKLGVDGLVEGTVRREGQRVRVNVRLVHGLSGDIVWSKRYEARIIDLLALEEQMSAEIAREVRVATGPAVREAPARSPVTTNVVAFDRYHRGREFWRNRTPSGIRQAMLSFRAAIDADPGFALAHAGLADAYRYFGALNYGPVVAYMDSARVEVARALALDSSLSEAHATLGALHTDAAEWEAAEAEFRRAIALDSANALAHHWYAMMLASIGRRDEALREIRMAKRLDRRSAPLNGILTQIENWAQVPRGEQMSSQRGLQVDPTFPNARFNAALQLSSQGDCAGARREIDAAKDLAPDNFLVLLSEAGVFLNCRDSVTGLRRLAELKRRPDARLNAVYLARGHVILGQLDSAFAWLDREEYWSMAKRFDLSTSRAFEPLRRDARYARVRDRLGLADGQRPSVDRTAARR